MVADILSVKNLLPLIIIFAGFLIGTIFEKIILREIKSISAKAKWISDDIFIKALRGTTTLLFLAAGIYWALETTEISREMLSFLHKVLFVIVIFSVTLILSRIAVGFVNLYSKRAGGAFISTSMFTNITRILVLIIGILIILQYVGISIAPILTALGVGGLAVALALQDTLSNLFAGIHVIASGQLKPGHYLRLSSGEEGYIADITWRYTTIRSLQNNTIIVPNSKLASAIVTNFNIPDQKILISIEAGVSYDSDLEKVERVTTEVAREVMKDIRVDVPGFDHIISYKKFGESSIDFHVYLHVKEFVDQYAVKHEFIKRLHKRYREEGIEIPFPVRTVYMKEKI
ncbi:MAG TPA: mechanosensitive ion channel family protein [Syntrophales bacterium]|nr:mechanosensitive ion channel family protein [Syntrophales bacterium]